MSSVESSQTKTVIASDFSQSSVRKDRPTRIVVQEALDANKRLQLILAERAEQLEADLKEADRLLQASNTDDADEDPETEVLIPGAKKAAGLLASSELLNVSSPFYDEASKRSKYLANTTPHPMKPKDLEVLGNAVRQENQRLQAYASLDSGLGSIVDIDTENNTEGLDWSRISERVSDASSVKRTPTECRVTWIGDRHPRLNHAEWSTAEIKNLEEILLESATQPVDWVRVAEQLKTNRTPIDCLRHGVPPPRHIWSPEFDKKLSKAVETCGIDNWHLVAKKVSEIATASQCQARWQKSLDPGIRRGAWSQEEDERLRKAVAAYGKSWVQVSTVMLGRTNDQCRERWTEHINSSSAKSTWSKEEDELLIKLVEELGKQWKAISLKLGVNKTGPSCRLRYDKLKRASRNTSIGTPPLSGVSPPTISNVAGPSQLVSTPSPETTSATLTFAVNLGQHSFVQPSTSFHTTFSAVNNPVHYPQAVDTNTNARDAVIQLSGTIEQNRDASDQSNVVEGFPNVPDKPGNVLTSQRPKGAIRTTKPRPKALSKLSKIVGQATHDTPDAIDAPDDGIESPLTEQSSGSAPSPSGETVPVSRKGIKRKLADNADLEKNQRPPKKVRTSKTALDKASDAVSEALDVSLSLNTPATIITTRTQTSNSMNSNDNPAPESQQPELRRGRSRKIPATEVHTTVQPERPAPVTPSNPSPKRPRGRPRKQA